MSPAVETSSPESLLLLLRVLRLPTVARCAEEVANKAEREGWSFGQYLRHLVELEVEERRRRRIERNLRDSELPGEKTLGTLEALPPTRALSGSTGCTATCEAPTWCSSRDLAM